MRRNSRTTSYRWFPKRLSDVFEDEFAHLAHDFGDDKKALKLVEKDHELVRFHVPEHPRWAALATKTTNLGEYLTDAMRAVARDNPGARRRTHQVHRSTERLVRRHD